MSALTTSRVVASKCIMGFQATDCHRWQVQTALTCFIHEELRGFFHLKIITMLAWENSRHLATIPLVSLPNDVWETSAEIPYWWCVTTQIWVVLQIGRAASQIYFNQPASSVWNFCACFSDVIWWGNQWQRRQMSAVFSGWLPTFSCCFHCSIISYHCHSLTTTDTFHK